MVDSAADQFSDGKAGSFRLTFQPSELVLGEMIVDTLHCVLAFLAIVAARVARNCFRRAAL